MTAFTLKLDLSDHQHAHSPMAQRHIVGQLLDQAKQAIGSGLAAQGEIIHTVAPFQRKLIGSWKFEEADLK